MCEEIVIETVLGGCVKRLCFEAVFGGCFQEVC